MKFDFKKVYTAINAEELKDGDKVYVSDSLDDLRDFVENDRLNVEELFDIREENFQRRFLVQGNANAYAFAYLVERAKEKKWRPYESIDEFVSDFIKRFNIACPKYGMPLIWIKSKETSMKHLVKSFYAGVEEVGIASNIIKLNWLFNEYEYLDGTPCGVKE